MAGRLAIVTRSTEVLIPAGQRLEHILAESLRDFARSRGARLPVGIIALR